jgi:hypothetical protein
MQTTVRIVEYDSMLYFEYFASRHELFAPHISEFLVAFRASAMASGLAGRQTNHRGFNATVGVESEGASEIGGFIVRVRSDAHESKHRRIVTGTYIA